MAGTSQSYTALASDAQQIAAGWKPTDAYKQRWVDEHQFTGDRDITSDHDLPGTRREGSLAVPPGQAADEVYLRRDYNWLKYFATEVAKVEETINQAKAKLASIDVKPGNFTQAHHIKTTTAALKTDYVANLDRVQNSLRLLTDKCEQVAEKYKTSDELNTASVEDLKGTFEAITGELGKLKSVSIEDYRPT